MKHRSVIISALFGVLFSFINGAALFAGGETCIDWPKVMARYELDHQPGGQSVVVEPFSNYTKSPEDDWMVLGLRDYIADLMKSAANLGVLAGNTAIYGRSTAAPAYTISGKFERTPERLRVFMSLKEGQSGKLVSQLDAAFPYPGNKEFFTKIAAAVEKALDTMEAKRDAQAFRRVRDATSSTSAYENYSRGRQILSTFSPENVEESAAFFTKAKRDDYRSPLGYAGTVDLNTFLGFYHKQRREPFGTFFQRAEEEINEMRRLTGESGAGLGPAGLKGRDSGIKNRFIAGNAAFGEALSARQLGNMAKTARALRRSVEAIPEDAISWYHLSRTLTATGDESGARDAMQKARGINPCIEE